MTFWRLPFNHRYSHNATSNPWQELLCSASTQKLNKAIGEILRLSFLSSSGRKLPTLLLTFFIHTTVSLLPLSIPLLSSTLSRNPLLSLNFSYVLLQFSISFSDSSNKHTFCTVCFELTATNCYLQNSSPTSAVKVMTWLLQEYFFMHFDVHQDTNSSMFFLLYGFNRTGLCIFKWQCNANTGIPFSMFVFSPHFVSNQEYRQASHRSLLRCIR